MSEVLDLLKKQTEAFELFKRTNDERLAQIEAKGHADPLIEGKVDKINATLAELEVKLREVEKQAGRGFLAGGPGDQVTGEHAKAFDLFVRKGAEDGLLELERKALNITTGSDGGYAVPEQIDSEILSLMQDVSPMRSVCRVVTVGTSDFKKLVNTHGSGSGWVGEDDARTETTAPGLAQVAAVMGELYANPFATQQSLDDIFYDVEAWLSAELAEAFGIAEGTAFVSGNGVKKPKGFLDYPTAATADSTRAFGSIEHIATGASGAFKTASASVSPADDLITAIYKMKAGLRAGASWMMNSTVLAAVRKWKTYGTGDYLWQPSTQAGQPSTLIGYPVTENEDMPGIDAGTIPIAFGNWRRAYTIVDRMGTRMLRDPYTNKPFVGFYTTKRVGGMLTDSNAIKLIKLASS